VVEVVGPKAPGAVVEVVLVDSGQTQLDKHLAVELLLKLQ
jgi:hypothetical protein